MIQYQFFFRNFVVRRPDQFTKPPLPKVERFELPVMAMTHYVSPSATNPWPNEDLLVYKNNIKPVRIIHHTQLAEFKGSPKINPGDINTLIRNFRSHNPRFRPAVDIESMKREPKNIVTHNYGLLANRYKYQRTLFTFHNRWYNIFATLFQSVGANTGTGYHQYIELQLPEKLPARSTLDKSVDGWNSRNMGIFNSYEMIFLHHIWVWLGERREIGLIHKYMPSLENVKIVLRESDRFSVLDMSLLNEWRKPSATEKKAWEKQKATNPSIEPLQRGVWAPSELQRMFLRLLMATMEVRAGDVPESLGDETVESVSVDIGVSGTNITSTGIATEPEMKDDVVVTGHSVTQDEEVTESSAYAGYSEEIDRINLLSEIDKDLEALEITSKEDEHAVIPESIDETEEAASDEDGAVDIVSATVPTKEPVFFPTDHTAAFKALCDRAAESNSITAAEYRRLIENSERFNSLPAPLGHEGIMEEFVIVKPELVAIKESPTVPDQPTILDKSMLKSSLLDFNKRYTKDVFQKDVASMVGQLRSAGISVNNYSVVEKEDITGGHYEYQITVKPIEGNTSTLSMKIPKIEEDGTFKVNGVAYKMRMQRGD